jgi:AcrR family transcriptional regulator
MADPSTPDQRETILAAAIAILQRDGAAALTVRNVAKEAGCSTTGVYTWFGGKGGLVEAIYVEGFESFEATLARAYESHDLVASGRAYRRWALENRVHYLVMFGSAVPDYTPSDTARKRAAQSFTDLVEAVKRAAPWIGDDAAAWAYHVFATVHGYVMLELIDMGGTDRQHFDDLYESGLQRILVRPPRSSPAAGQP